jgi:hypothetical protein
VAEIGGNLKADAVVGSFRRDGARLTVISIASAIVLGVIDQFTSKIVPSTADYIHDLFLPPQFLVSFAPPVDTAGGLSLALIGTGKVDDIRLKETVTGTRVYAASAGPGTYLLRLQGTGERRGKELVATKKIEKSGETWLVDSAERNWASTSEITAGPPSAAAATTGAPPASSRLSNTRWTVTEQDYAVLAKIDSKVLRSLLLTALAQVGIYEFGTDWEKQHISSYGAAAGSPWATTQEHFPWGGAFVGWLVAQTFLTPPPAPASYKNWENWNRDVTLNALQPGMIGIFQLNNKEIPEASSRLLVGPIVRRQPGCIEVILGNIANRVVITCVAIELLVSVRDPTQS